LRNLTFERSRTTGRTEGGAHPAKHNVGDVLAHGYGTDEELTLLFVAMTRSAGFDGLSGHGARSQTPVLSAMDLTASD